MNTATPRGSRAWSHAVCAATALLLAAGMAGCGSGTPAAAPATTSAPGSSAPGPAAPSSASSSSTTAVASPSLAIHRFTSHPLSFRYPADWSVAADVQPIGATGDQRETATISDASGRKILGVYVNWTPQDVGFDVTRAVLDAEPVPGLGSAAVTPGYYAFYAETWSTGMEYFMTLAPGRPIDGPAQRHGGPFGAVVQIAAGYSVAADVPVDVLQFGSPEAATSWLASDEGQRIKAVLMSLTVY